MKKKSILYCLLGLIIIYCAPVYIKNIPEQLAYRDYILKTVNDCITSCDKRSKIKESTILFTILKNGNISSVKIDTINIYTDFDEIIINCFKEIKKFKPLPPSFADSCNFKFEIQNPFYNKE